MRLGRELRACGPPAWHLRDRENPQEVFIPRIEHRNDVYRPR
jgi:hypothetical protein